MSWRGPVALLVSITAAGAASAVVAAIAVAEPAAPPLVWAEPDPATVIGHWRGPATWRACGDGGAARVTLDVHRDGSGYAVDLAAVLDGLGRTSLVPAAAQRLEMKRDDLRIEWRTGKHNKATLTIQFGQSGSGCTGTLRLTRDATGAPACDRLAALARIASTCDGATPVTISDADRLVIAGANRAGRARTAAARLCTQHAAPVETALIEAGCVPAPTDGSAPGVRVVECDALVAAVSRLMRCDRVPVDVKQRLHAGMQRVSRWATVTPGDDEAENRARAAATCEAARVDLEDTMSFVHCGP